MFISTYLFMTLFLEHWDGTDPGVFAIHSNEWKLRGKLWLFMRWTNDIGKIDECKCNSKAKVHFVAVYFISLSIWQYCTALHCTALGYLSSVLNSILNGHKTFGHIQQKYAHRGQNIYLVATTPFYLPLFSTPKSWQQDQDPTLSRPLRWRGT